MAPETPGSESRETQETLSNLLHETRRFAPPAELAAAANVTAEAYAEAEQDRLAFWAEQADRLTWSKRWDTTLDWQPAVRQVVRRRRAQRRLQLRGPPRRGRPRRQGRLPLGGRARATAAPSPTPSCNARSAKAANALTELGVGKGDRVAIYMPMIPETVDRDAGLRPHRRVALGGLRRVLRRRAARPDPGRRRQASSSPPTAATAAARPARSSRPWTRRSTSCPGIEHVLVVRRTGQDVDWTDGRDVWWHDIVGPAVRRAHGAAVRRRAPAVHPLHLAAPPVSPRASCTPRAATSPRSPTPTTRSSTSSRRPTSTGAPPTSAG